MARIHERTRSLKQADQTHDWVKGVELPWCKDCGMSKVSAHIWGDDDWTKEPVACSKYLHALDYVCIAHFVLPARR